MLSRNLCSWLLKSQPTHRRLQLGKREGKGERRREKGREREKRREREDEEEKNGLSLKTGPFETRK